MSDKIKRIIPVTPDHSVILYEAADPREGSYISIKHNEKVNNMPGEVMIAPGDTPALVKALTEAALELTQSGNHLTGHSDGTKNYAKASRIMQDFADKNIKKKLH